MNTFSFNYPIAIKIIAMQVCNILHYFMVKIYCQKNNVMQVCNFCNIACQQILHDCRETYKTENAFISTFIHKDKCHSMIQQILQQTFCHTTESLCRATKAFSHTINQLLHQYHNTVKALSNPPPNYAPLQ